ncbi:MAG: hypothetical protein AB7S26_30200 [Sandaracinaceae bacterium]
MFGHLPEPIRLYLPPVILGLSAAGAAILAIQLFVLVPDLPLLAASFAMCAALHAIGVWGLLKGAFWARGFAIGAIATSGLGFGFVGLGGGVALPAGLVAVLLLLDGDAAGRYERRSLFLERKAIDIAGAQRLFLVALGLGVGLTLLLGSPLSLTLVLRAPLATSCAAAFGVLGFLGLSRLSSWCYFAIAAAAVSLVVAIVSSAWVGSSTLAMSVGAPLVAFLLTLVPLTGPVVRALRAPR